MNKTDRFAEGSKNNHCGEFLSFGGIDANKMIVIIPDSLDVREQDKSFKFVRKAVSLMAKP